MVGGFKAINDSLLPEAFKPTALKKGEDREELFNRWRDELVESYELYSNTEDSASMTLVSRTLKRLYEEGALMRNNRRTVRELQEKYAQLALILANEPQLAEGGLSLLEDPLIKLHELFPEALEILAALVNILIRQRQWLKAFHAAKYALKKQPFERSLIYSYLHALFNLGLFDEFEEEQRKYSCFVNYQPLRVPDHEEEYRPPEVTLTLERLTWNCLLKAIADQITKAKGPVWTCLVTKIDFKVSDSFSLEASGFNTPSQSYEMLTDVEEESSQQPLVKKRAASAQARKNLKKQRVLPNKKNGTQFGFDLEAFLRKYNMFSAEMPYQIQILQEQLQVPQLELDCEFLDELEGQFVVEIVYLILSKIPQVAWILTEFIDFLQALLDRNSQRMLTNEKMLIEVSKIFKERKIEANREKLLQLSFERELKDVEKNLTAVEVETEIKEDDPNIALGILMDRMSAFNLQTLVDNFLCRFNTTQKITIHSDSQLALLVILSKKLVMEKVTQTKFLSYLYLAFVEKLELDESIYELSMMLQKNEVLTPELALAMALQCPSGMYQWELLRALYKLGRVKNVAEPPAALNPLNGKIEMNLVTAQAIVKYLDECWKSIDCNLDEVALLRAIEVVLENVNIRGSDQMVLQSNLGKMKRYFRTECHDIFDYSQNRVPPLLPVRSSEELELRKRVLEIRIEVCEDAFSNRKRNVEWLKSFRKDLLYMLVCSEATSEEFAEYWEKVAQIHFEIAYQLLSLDPFAIRGRENKIRRNLKKYAMMALLSVSDYNRVAEALFMMLHSLAAIDNDVRFRIRALRCLLNISVKAKGLNGKSRLLCALALLQGDHPEILQLGKEALLTWIHAELQDVNLADNELLYLACFFAERMGCLPEKMLRERLGVEIESSVLGFIGPQFNLHKEREEVFPFLLKPKGLTFCGVHVPAILPGFTNFCVQELTKELIDGDEESPEEVESLLLVLNRLRVLESQLPQPTGLIVRCTQKLFAMAQGDFELIEPVLKEASNNKSIPEVSVIVERLKVLKKSK